MNIKYEWKIDFTIILTILGVIGSFIYTFFSNYKNSKITELKTLSEMIEDIIYLLGFPLRNKMNTYLYKNENKIIERIINKKIKEFDLDLDWYWSSYNKIDPEIKKLSSFKQKSILNQIEIEYERIMKERLSLNGLILSPAFYCDFEDVKIKINNITKKVISNSFVFCKPIRLLLGRITENDPQVIMEKYKLQLNHDPNYFSHNAPQFDDPYRYLLLLLKRRHDWLSMTKVKKFKEIIRQFRWCKGMLKFRRNKWIYIGPFV